MSQITVVALDGESAPTVIPGGYSPAWSPDGSRIAFATYDPRTGSGVWTMVPDGSDRRLLTRHALSDLAWSPDGKQIALAVSDGIAVVNGDGSALKVLTGVGGYGATWSPDGQAIAFNRICWDSPCTPSVFYVTSDGRTTGLLIENGLSSSWHT